ncbi:MAG: 1-(5-phosphoribosyl)-5-[(5-phosphoribosylamino)methylideneamino]imidazole-4-carboxamide isomerase [Acidimicrobiales bacterium]
MELFPAIDIREGRSVRLVQGDFSRETVYGDPVDRAKELLGMGARWLHVVDLDAAVSGVRANRTAVEKIATLAGDAGGSLQVGGGVRDEVAVRELLDAGVTRVVIGTAALADPELVAHLAACHPGRIVLGLDYRLSDGGGRDKRELISRMMLSTEGWTSGNTVSMEDALTWFEGTGVAAVVATNIGRDGTMSGPDLPGMGAIVSDTEIAVVASGGVAGLDDLIALREVEAGGRSVSGVIVGKALLEGSFTLEEGLEVCRGGVA